MNLRKKTIVKRKVVGGGSSGCFSSVHGSRASRWACKQSSNRMSIASAIIFGSVLRRMGKSQSSIQDRMGLLQVAAINTAMASLTKAGAAFPLLFGTILYPMARLHPTFSRFGKFCGIVTVESFAASAMGLTVGLWFQPLKQQWP
ncbi:ABC transporter G family member 7 [Camellia lanceoleosa]|uniref:ABC transporter G family member 7 n=1 Tax=Camellia lanceoleosa TaxID=1840588 RepID=A0ACC0G2I1_9ERIC|nr:ABC transporter G family member 7 [Camellia lanceoleosa]